MTVTDICFESEEVWWYQVTYEKEDVRYGPKTVTHTTVKHLILAASQFGDFKIDILEHFIYGIFFYLMAFKVIFLFSNGLPLKFLNDSPY